MRFGLSDVPKVEVHDISASIIPLSTVKIHNMPAIRTLLPFGGGE